MVIPGPVNGFHQGMERAHARLAAARSRTGARRHDLVDRHVRQRARAVRSEDRTSSRSIRSKTPASGPHGLEFDKDGNLWFTANSKGYIGKLDPKTGDDHRVQAARRRSRSAHAALRAERHALLHRAERELRRPPQSEDRRDQGRQDADRAREPVRHGDDDSKACRSSATSARTRSSGSIPTRWRSRNTSCRTPRAGRGGSRSVRDDIIWYADYSRGYLGRLDPNSGKVTEWPSPSGPKSQPYGITYLNGAIWYVESAIKPNVLVRFDIKTEKFQSWVIPGGGGVVRNIKATDDGNIVMAESGVNKIALVTVAPLAISSGRTHRVSRPR